MHAYILSSREKSNDKTQIANITEVNKAIQVPFVIQKIEDVRDLKKLVSLSFNQKTAIVIDNIDTATEAAQNAFLKNLEEPQKNIIYILTAKNIHSVIPTILSRCELVKTKNGSKNNPEDEASLNFLNLKIDAKLEYIGKIKDREVALQLVENLLFTEHANGDYTNMEHFLYCIKNLKQNGNVPLQLLNLVVKMNSRTSY
jgi:DNA polymerase III delta prime subunit